MNYTYTLIQGSSCIQRVDVDTGLFSTVPADPGNLDYQAYLAWVSAGNVISYPAQSAAQLRSAYQDAAQAALDKSDTTVHRIAEAVALGLNTWTAADVVAYMNWRRALRTIVSTETGTPGTLPTQPAYPAGT